MTRLERLNRNPKVKTVCENDDKTWSATLAPGLCVPARDNAHSFTEPTITKLCRVIRKGLGPCGCDECATAAKPADTPKPKGKSNPKAEPKAEPKADPTPAPVDPYDGEVDPLFVPELEDAPREPIKVKTVPAKKPTPKKAPKKAAPKKAAAKSKPLTKDEPSADNQPS